MNKKEFFKNKINETFFDLTEQILVVIDTKGKVVDINKMGCQILGCRKKNIIGKDWFNNFLPRQIKKQVKEVFKKILKGELKEVEYYENPVIDKKGRLKLISWHNNYLKDDKNKICLILSSGKNITEKRQAELKLNQQLNLFKLLFEFAPDGFFILDFKGNIKDVNRAVEKLSGYKKEELIGKNIFKLNLLSKKYFAVALKSLMKNIKGEQSGPYEYELISKNGKTIFVEIIARPVQLSDEYAILCLARDITEKKELLKRLELDSLILKSLNDPVFICDGTQKLIYKNDAFDNISSNKESVSKQCCDFLIYKNKDYLQILKEIKKNKSAVYEADFKTKDKTKSFEIYSKLIKIDDKELILNIAREMTQRIQTEEEIRNMVEELNQILNSASSAIFITSKDATILKANKRFYELFELKESDVLGKKCTEIFYVEFHDCFFKKIMAGETINDFESRITIRTGKKLYVLINAMPFKNVKGEIVGVIADFKDIEKIKEAEKILQESYKKLKELDSLKTTFFSMVSHELKNPLTSIKGFATLLYKGAAGDLSQQQKEFIETIHNNTERLLNLINELLDMSRIESGTFSVQKKNTDIIETIRKSIKEMEPIANQKNIKIIFKSDIEKYFMEIDDYRIMQVIINILNNAIKFMPNDKNIFFSANLKDKSEIVLPDYADLNLENKKYFVIKIMDEGPGINRENLIKIFEKFYQIKNTDKTKGLGLGLFIAKAIIDAHNGFIYAESEGEGKGTTFSILL